MKARCELSRRRGEQGGGRSAWVELGTRSGRAGDGARVHSSRQSQSMCIVYAPAWEWGKSMRKTRGSYTSSRVGASPPPPPPRCFLFSLDPQFLRRQTEPISQDEVERLTNLPAVTTSSVDPNEKRIEGQLGPFLLLPSLSPLRSLLVPLLTISA